jgi:hypothetical protein
MSRNGPPVCSTQLDDALSRRNRAFDPYPGKPTACHQNGIKRFDASVHAGNRAASWVAKFAPIRRVS